MRPTSVAQSSAAPTSRVRPSVVTATRNSVSLNGDVNVFLVRLPHLLKLAVRDSLRGFLHFFTQGILQTHQYAFHCYADMALTLFASKAIGGTNVSIGPVTSRPVRPRR